MNQISGKVVNVLKKYGITGSEVDSISDELQKLYKDEGYVHIPTSKGRNTVVHSFDSENERVMTFDEWAEEATDKGWTRPE